MAVLTKEESEARKKAKKAARKPPAKPSNLLSRKPTWDKAGKPDQTNR